MDVYRISEDFDFDTISLTTPTGIQGGAYFSKLKNDSEKLFIQTSKCSSKNGVKKSGKKLYCDLMFNSEDSEFYDWMEKMEEKVKSLILKNKETWFHDELEKDDIDYNWNSGLRTYKQKFYLFRTFIEKQKLNNGPKLQIFNEDEEKLTLDDIKSTSKMVCILEIKGLKFTSQSFHLECSLTQIMLINEDEILMDKCLIRREKKKRKEILENKEIIENKKLEVKEDSIESENIEDENIEDENIEDENTVIETNENKGNDLLKMEDKTETLEKNDENVSKKEDDENMEKNLEIKEESLEKNDEILEVNLELPDDLEINKMKLKKPNEVYIEMYRSAKNKAKLAKKLAIQAYLESKEIKKTYMLDLDDSSDDEDLEKMINNDETDENNKLLN